MGAALSAGAEALPEIAAGAANGGGFNGMIGGLGKAVSGMVGGHHGVLGLTELAMNHMGMGKVSSGINSVLGDLGLGAFAGAANSGQGTGDPIRNAALTKLNGFLPNAVQGGANMLQAAMHPAGPQSLQDLGQHLRTNGIQMAQGALASMGNKAGMGNALNQGGDVLSRMAKGLSGGQTIGQAWASSGGTHAAGAFARGAVNSLANKAAGITGMHPQTAANLGNSLLRNARNVSRASPSWKPMQMLSKTAAGSMAASIINSATQPQGGATSASVSQPAAVNNTVGAANAANPAKRRRIGPSGGGATAQPDPSGGGGAVGGGVAGS